jgi:hypothetical protein
MTPILVRPYWSIVKATALVALLNRALKPFPARGFAPQAPITPAIASRAHQSRRHVQFPPASPRFAFDQLRRLPVKDSWSVVVFMAESTEDAAAGLEEESTESTAPQSLWRRVKSYFTPKDGLSTSQRMRKMGLAVGLSYGFVSNMSSCVFTALAWYTFAAQVCPSLYRHSICRLLIL